MDYERLKTFIRYDAPLEENYQFVMIKTLLMTANISREFIANKILEENKDKPNTTFINIGIYDNLIKRGVINESKHLYTLVGFKNFSEEEKNMLTKLCQERIDELKEGKKIKPPNYWKVAPGIQAQDWKRQKNQRIIGIGWSELGDLTGLTEKQVNQRISDKIHSGIAVISTQFKNFLKIKRGDIIIANKGKSIVVGIGKVIGDYKYDPNQNYRHTYPVNWFWTSENKVPFQSNWFITVVPVPVELYKTIISPKQFSNTNFSQEVEDLIETFDKNPGSFDGDWKWRDVEVRNNEHKEFIRKFPIDNLENIKVDNYVQGKPDPVTADTNRNTFCYILEHGLYTSGSIPGTTYKFGIYFDKEKNEYILAKDHTSWEDAFAATKYDIYSIVDAGRQFKTSKDWKKLSDIVDDTEHQIHKRVSSKLLAAYFPESFLAIHNKDKIDTALYFLKISKSILQKKLTLKQAKLIELKNSHTIMKNWDVYKYSIFLYNVIIPLAEKKRKNQQVKKEEESTGEKIFDYSIDYLPTPTLDDLKELKVGIAQKILINDEKLEEIIASLVMGKNVLLTGAVGTGKTHLATILPEIAWKKYGGYYSMLYTATSDWTTQNVIGGITPKVDSDKKITYEIQKGCVSNTVSKNWKEDTSSSNARTSFEARNIDDNLQKFKGVWLIIDEFNRANIDKAFGQMFTALEYKKMQIPTIASKEAFEDLIIPEDYRIIGTLNTADKHYLHSLSDALKRRFSIIEIPIPEYLQKNEELYFVISKAIENLDNIDLVLSDKPRISVKGEIDLDAEKIIDTLYTIMLFIREIKPLGTALLISMLRFMIVNHSLKLVKKENWDSSLDGALVTIIIPQIEDLNYWTLKVIRAALIGELGDFFVNDPEIKDDGYEKYKKDFQKMVNCIEHIRGKRRNIVKRFMTGKLGPYRVQIEDDKEIFDKQDMEYLRIWNTEIVGLKPKLPKFTNAINQIISEKGIDEEIEE